MPNIARITVLGHLRILNSPTGRAGGESFVDLRSSIKDADFDVALVDFDLADGRTGGDAAAWLKARGCPSIFITGQEQLAQTYSEMSAGLIVKPVSTDLLAYALERIRSH